MKTILLLLPLAILCSCTTGYVNKSKGIVAFNMIGTDASKFVASPDGFYAEGVNNSKAFKTGAVAVVAWEAIGQIASVIKNSDAVAGNVSNTKTAAGVTKGGQQAGVAVNASNNAVKIVKSDNATKVLLGEVAKPK